MRSSKAGQDPEATARDIPFGFLDPYAKREIRRSVLKALCLPGYQVPYASREMPMGRGFGTGGLQLTLSIIGPRDVLKVIDQGSDDSVNAVNLRSFILRTCTGVEETTRTQEATLIQTRHRIPEIPLQEGQILVLQVPIPDPLTPVEPSEGKRKTMHGEADYSRILVKLYEDLCKFNQVAISSSYPTRINGYYVLSPSPIPRFDVPKMHFSKAPLIFGAGREKKIYALPPYTSAEPLSFEDVPFEVEQFVDDKRQRRTCSRCGAADSYLEESEAGDGSRTYLCSDTDFCRQRSALLPANLTYFLPQSGQKGKNVPD
ncbi:MAG: alpha-D-ribose 1-methylphosphonate 5-phosphate C-P-lyase PhnJ [Desulfovermiculus sp.]